MKSANYQSEFGTVRAVFIEDKPWYVYKDVVAVLGYVDKYSIKYMPIHEKHMCSKTIRTNYGPRAVYLIDAAGVEDVLKHSKKPRRARVSKWFHECVFGADAQKGSRAFSILDDLQAKFVGEREKNMKLRARLNSVEEILWQLLESLDVPC